MSYGTTVSLALMLLVLPLAHLLELAALLERTQIQLGNDVDTPAG